MTEISTAIFPGEISELLFQIRIIKGIME